MSEYNMTHTGAELDSAISKVHSGYIMPSGTKPEEITSNGRHNVKEYEFADVNVSDSQHFAFGYKTMSANTSFEVTGITDSQGNSFKPKGYAFTLLPASGSEFTGGSSAPSLVACVYDTVNKRMTRTRTGQNAWSVFANVSVSSGTVAEGSFRQAASSDKKYNCFGAEYFWIAWG